jgi:hypothetical protein
VSETLVSETLVSDLPVRTLERQAAAGFKIAVPAAIAPTPVVRVAPLGKSPRFRGQFTVTKVTPDCLRPRYYSGHDPFRVSVMTRMWRNSLEAAAAVGMIVLATLVVHSISVLLQ